jgi:Spy/CpxP family protein refolding chaperone
MVLTIKRAASLGAAAISLLAAIAVQAQTPGAGTGPRRPSPQQMQAMREKAYKDLGITTAQRQKLDAIEKRYGQQIRTKMQAFQKNNPNATPQQAMAEVRPLAVQAQKEQMAVLTPAQRDKLKKRQAEQMKKMRSGTPAPR